MSNYIAQYLALSDQNGCPQELVNGARLASNLINSQLCGQGIFSNVLPDNGCPGLRYVQGMPSALSDPVLWLDAANASATDQYARNLGTGASLLNAIMGANTSVGTDEPLWLGGSTPFLYTPAVAGNNASIPDTAGLRLSTDFEIVFRIAADDWTPASTQSLVSKFTAGSQGYEVFLNTGGTLALIMRIGGSDVTATSTAAPTVNDGVTLWIRIQRVSATGVVSFWTAPGDNDAPPIAWGLLGATVASTAGALTSGTTALFLGERPNNTQSAAVKLYRVILRQQVSDLTTTASADIDLTANTVQAGFYVTGVGPLTVNRSQTGRKSVVYTGRPLWLFGTDDYMQIPDSDLLDFAQGDSFTVMVVHRAHNVSTPATQLLLYKSNGTNAGYTLSNGVASSTTSFSVLGGTGSASSASPAKTASVLATVAGVLNRPTLQSVAYLNGVVANAVTDTTNASSANSSAFYIGGNIAANNLDAEVVAVMVWRRALSAAEIAAVSTFYTNGYVPVGPTVSPAAVWQQIDTTSVATSPWYLAASAASAEALGILIEDMTGADGAVHQRSAYPIGQRQGGAYFGPATNEARTMKFNVVLHGTTERGLTYLFRWLEMTLQNCCSSQCSAQQMWWREFCPTNPATDPAEGLRRAERVVLVEGPTWESPIDDTVGCYIRRASFALVAGDPCLYGEPSLRNTPNRSLISGVTIYPTATTSQIASCSTWAGSSRRAFADLPVPHVGNVAPVVIISSPIASYTASGITARATLPIMRIAGYSDPNNYGDPCRAQKVGELILEGIGMAGLTLYVDLAQRTVTYDDPYAGVFGADGSGFIGAALTTGVTRWWSLNNCTSGFVIVEPAYATLDAVRTVGVASGVRVVSEWTTTIKSETRLACC